jgi:uncharacterized protein YecT (DUF1311 family)
MTRILPILVLALCALPAHAQYEGPAVEACRAFALSELEREGTEAKAVIIERDRALSLEREPRKVGAQRVSSVLTGNGAVVFDGAPSAELSFLCLLADEKRPVFFAWQPRPNAPALLQCTRAGKGLKAAPCLELMLRVAEQDLSEVYAHRFQEANERGEKSLAAYRKANEEWREYREAECARRRDLAPAAVSPDDFQAACMVELTRRRALDMR